MAISFVNKSAFASGTSALTVGAVSGLVAGDLILLFVESANQAITTPSGYTAVTGAQASAGTAAAAGGMRLNVFYRWATGTDTTTSVADTGDHTTAIKLAYRGVDKTTPFDADAVTGSKTTASTSSAYPGITTVTAGAEVIFASALDLDSASTATTSGWANTNIVGLGEVHDQTISSGVGGGLVIADGRKESAGATGNTTATVTSTRQVYVTLALRPILLSHTLPVDTEDLGLFEHEVNLRVLKSYSMAIDSFDQVLQGYGAGIRFNRSLPVTAYALGITAPESNGVLARKLVAEPHSLVATGANVGVNRGYFLGAGADSLSLTGLDVAISQQFPPPGPAIELALSELGWFELAGELSSDKVVTATATGLVLHSYPIGLGIHRRLQAAASDFAFAGQDVRLLGHRILLAGLEGLAVSGQSVGLKLSRKLLAGTALLGLEGQAARSLLHRNLKGAKGLLSLASVDMRFGGNKVLAASLADLGWTAHSAGLTVQRKMLAAGLPLVLIAYGAGVRRNMVLPASSQLLGLTAEAATLRKTFLLAAEATNLVLSGEAKVLRQFYAFAESHQLQAEAAQVAVLINRLIAADWHEAALQASELKFVLQRAPLLLDTGFLMLVSRSATLRRSHLPPAYDSAVREMEIRSVYRPHDPNSLVIPLPADPVIRPVELRNASVEVPISGVIRPIEDRTATFR